VQPNLAILAGEVSGDLAGGALARALREMRPDLALWGMGTRRMAEAGVEILRDCAAWGAIGVVEALKVYPELRFKIYPRILREIERRQPAAAVLIDFGAFNVKVARECKKRGIPVLYYFPPGSWKRTGRLNPEIARITDRIATPFPWSAERLATLGANVTFVGHPLLELAHPAMTRAQFADRFGMEPGNSLIGLLPGSRAFEVEHNTPAMLGAARLIHREIPEAQFVFGLASEVARQKVEEALLVHRTVVAGVEKFAQRTTEESDIDRQLAELERSGPRLVTPEGVEVPANLIQQREDAHRFAERMQAQFGLPPVILTEGLTYDVMAHSDVLLVCSGTATLEAAILGTPMVIFYRGSKLMEMEAKLRRVRPEHIGMPNIIAGERIVPELLQHDATPEALAENALRFLREPDTRARVKAELEKVRAALGEPGASARTARIALELAGLPPA
jgi:lipid-A-disaccharide synthase